MMFPWYVALGITLATAYICLRMGNQRGVVLFLVVMAFLVYVQGVDTDPECVDYGHAARVC